MHLKTMQVLPLFSNKKYNILLVFIISSSNKVLLSEGWVQITKLRVSLVGIIDTEPTGGILISIAKNYLVRGPRWG